jgi:membrane-associated phospholipid phosphatase
MLFYASSVSVATIYGRYHYGADVAAGFGVSLAAAAVAFALRDRGGFRRQ